MLFLKAQPGQYKCTCNCGWTGTNCDSIINQCSNSPCLNGGICQTNGCTFSCTCPTLYSGTVCQFQTNNCASNPCLNGGLCQNTVFGFSCICLNSYTGSTCQTMVDVNSFFILLNLKKNKKVFFKTAIKFIYRHSFRRLILNF